MPPVLEAALLALGGGAVFALAGAPHPWLLGPMAATLAAGLCGRRPKVPGWLPQGLLVLIGTNVGGALTPEMAAQAGQWLPSLIGLLPALAAALVVGTLILWKGAGLSLSSAFYGASPGHLMMSLAGAEADPRADLRAVAMAQSVRLVMLVSVVPSILHVAGGSVPIPGGLSRDPVSVVIALAAGVAGAALAVRLKVPAGLLTGSILAAGAAALGGWSLGRLPVEIGNGMLAVVGAMIGIRFAAGSVLALLKALPWSVLSVGAAMAASAAVALPMATLIGRPAGDLLLAYSPGGADVMPLIAVSLGLQPAFVALHHVARLLLMAVAMPLLTVWLRRWNEQASTPA